MTIEGGTPVDGGVDAARIAKAEAVYRLRQHRDRLFGIRLFCEPAWDMLLDLYIARARGRRLSPTSLSLGARCSSATAIRYVAVLTDAGLVSSADDELNGRRRFISLTEDGLRRMATLLDAFDVRR